MSWWMWPSRLTAFFLLPIYLACCACPPSLLELANVRGDYFTSDSVLLGVYSLLAFAGGAFVAETLVGMSIQRKSHERYALEPRVIHALFLVLALLTLAGYALLLFGLVSDAGAVASALKGGYANQTVATTIVRENAGRGSSLMCLQGLAATAWMYGRMQDPEGFRKARYTALMLAIVGACLVRVLAVSERLALVELLLPPVLAWMILNPRPRATWRIYFPIIGVLGLVGIFGFFEYFRSWQVYRYKGISMPEFVFSRFANYYVTALNNGVLLLQSGHSDAFGRYTFSGIYDTFVFKTGVMSNLLTRYEWNLILTQYGNPEFNNISGLFLPIVDFGVIGGLFVLAMSGVILGAMASYFAIRAPRAIIVYPIFFVGNWEILRIFYWGDGRFLVSGLAGAVLLLLLSGARQRSTETAAAPTLRGHRSKIARAR